MITSTHGAERPPLHLLASESDIVSGLALTAEQRQPVVAAMLLEEIERAELHDSGSMPGGHVGLGSKVTFVDEKTGRVRTLQLVLPADADMARDRLSIMTPMGAALYGLAAGHVIEWPDINGNSRPIRVIHVAQEDGKKAPATVPS